MGQTDLMVCAVKLLQCSAVQRDAVQCSAFQCSAIQYSAVNCSAVEYSTLQCIIVQCNTVQCSATQCSGIGGGNVSPPVENKGSTKYCNDEDHHYTAPTGLHCTAPTTLNYTETSILQCTTLHQTARLEHIKKKLGYICSRTSGGRQLVYLPG